MLTDGRFDDWDGVPNLIDDPEDAPPPSAVDLDDLKVQDDPEYVHLSLEVGRRVNPQSMPGSLLLILDGDGDPGTGGTIHDVKGADAAVALSFKPGGADEPGYGTGVAVGYPGSDGPVFELSGYVAGLLIAPTHAADHLEIRLERGFRVPGSPPLLTSDSLRIQVVYEDTAGVRDRTVVAAYGLKTTPGEIVSGTTDTSRPPGTFRVLQWNVSGERFRDEPGAYSRIIAGLAPDVLLLDEVSGSMTTQELEQYFSLPILHELGPWTAVMGRTGGRQRGAVVTRSDWAQPEIHMSERVDYPPGTLDELARRIQDQDFREELERERDWGVPTVASWAEIGGRLAMFVALDLQSTGYEGSAEDLLRELQAETLRGRIDAALMNTAGQAVILGGDFNLVGSQEPLEILADDLDVDGTDLEMAEPYRIADRSQVTWSDRDHGPFTPGRLDYILYPDAAAELVNSFVFSSEELTEAELERIGVRREDSSKTSNHMPVVVDLRWR